MSAIDSRGTQSQLREELDACDRWIGASLRSASGTDAAAAAIASDWMEIIDPDLESNPRTVRHRTINGAGFVARILRGKR